MNNKRGGVGAKILLVLILMIASAIGGAYGYRVLDGKMAVNDAKKSVSAVRMSDYDTEEAAELQSLIDDTTKDLETAATRKEVYSIMEDFNTDVAKIKTKTQKELEEALKEAEEARKNSSNNNNYNNSNGLNYYGNDDDYYDGSDSSNSNSNSNNNNNSSSNNNSNNNNSNSNSSNSSSGSITNDDGSSGRGGLLGSLLGGSDSDD